MNEETQTALAPEGAGEADPNAAPKPKRRRSRGGRGRGGGSKPKAETAASSSEVSEEASAVSASPEASAADAPSKPRRRRSRGGRGRGKSKAAGTVAPSPASDTATAASALPDIPDVAAASDTGADVAASGDAATPSPAKRRSRRGGRGRGKKPAAAADTGTEDAVATTATGEEAKPAPRARRPRALPKAGEKPKAAAEAEAGTEPAAKTARPSTRRGARKTEEAAGAAGPTRLRRQRTTTTGGRRRREPLPFVPRVTDKLMVITEHGDRDQIAVLEDRDLVQHYVTRAGATSMVGNVYLGRVQNVLPGMEAAFVDVGRGRNAVLYAGEVNYSPEDLEGPAPRIEHVLKSGQSVLVQVTKDPIGGKGARLTAQISMPGRYLVLVPNSDVSGISRRLPDDERKRLKAIVKNIRPEGHGMIVRTAAEGASEEALAGDVARLVAEWDGIEKRAKRAKAPFLLYEEPELTVRVVRDLFNDEEFRELVTDSPRVYELVTGYLREVAPDLLEKVRLHQGKLPAFEEFHVVEQIHKGLDRKVWLPSGGYLIIERTEAMTVIDVNTGKSVGKANLEETVVNTNLEAAREVARQLRLRDIGGMIIVDFIDMLLEKNKKQVVDTVKEAMAQDKTRSQVFDISPLGLLEVTRKRVSGGLLESFSETCPTCEGRGHLLTYEM